MGERSAVGLSGVRIAEVSMGDCWSGGVSWLYVSKYDRNAHDLGRQ